MLDRKALEGRRAQHEVGGRHAVGLGQSEPLVTLTERGVVARVGKGFEHNVGIEGAAVRESLAMIADHSDADAL